MWGNHIRCGDSRGKSVCARAQRGGERAQRGGARGAKKSAARRKVRRGVVAIGGKSFLETRPACVPGRERKNNGFLGSLDGE